MRAATPSLLPVLALAACVEAGVTDDDDTVPAAPCDVDGYDGVPGVHCSGHVGRLQGTLTSDVTIGPDFDWVLVGGVFVGDDTHAATLTVLPGTTVYGDSATDGFLVVQRGARLVADGRADAPIVFTSDQEPGSRSRSDWGGLVLNGRAPTNVCPDPSRCDIPGEGGTGTYGGDEPDDDSGVLRYVRVEFAGTLINDRQEVNGIAFQGVGRGTTVDHVHVHMAADDTMEFFGGTVDVRHVILTGAGDDGFDWTNGWSGRAQHVVVQHHGDAGDNGIEADNNADDNDVLPRSSPRIQNMTVIGGRADDAPRTDLGMLLREGTAGQLRKVVVLGHRVACGDVDDASTFAQAWKDGAAVGALDVSRSAFSCPDLAAPFPADEQDVPEVSVDDLFRTVFAGNAVGDDPRLGAPFDEVTPGFLPTAGSPLLDGAGDDLDDPFFEPTTYLGAFGEEDWASWTMFAPD